MSVKSKKSVKTTATQTSSEEVVLIYHSSESSVVVCDTPFWFYSLMTLVLMISFYHEHLMLGFGHRSEVWSAECIQEALGQANLSSSGKGGRAHFNQCTQFSFSAPISTYVLTNRCC